MEKTLTIRVAEGDLRRWKDAAWGERVSLSEWVRRRCDGGLAAGADGTREETAGVTGRSSGRPAPAASPSGGGLGAGASTGGGSGGQTVALPPQAKDGEATATSVLQSRPSPAPSSFQPDFKKGK